MARIRSVSDSARRGGNVARHRHSRGPVGAAAGGARPPGTRAPAPQQPRTRQLSRSSTTERVNSAMWFGDRDVAPRPRRDHRSRRSHPDCRCGSADRSPRRPRRSSRRRPSQPACVPPAARSGDLTEAPSRSCVERQGIEIGLGLLEMRLTRCPIFLGCCDERPDGKLGQGDRRDRRLGRQRPFIVDSSQQDERAGVEDAVRHVRDSDRAPNRCRREARQDQLAEVAPSACGARAVMPAAEAVRPAERLASRLA